MDMFDYLGVDMNNDTLSEILEKLNAKGVGNASIIPKNAAGEPLGMFLLLADTGAIPYVKSALDEYDSDCQP